MTAGVFQGNQTEVASDLLATPKALRLPDDQHERHRGEWPDARMGRQSLRLGTLLHLLLHRLAQLRDDRIPSIQQLQQVVPSPAGPRSQGERLKLRTLGAPQPLLTTQTFVQRYRLQLIHDPAAGLHHAVTMPQQFPQIWVPSWENRDLRKVVFQHQLQNQLGILTIGLLLAYALPLD